MQNIYLSMIIMNIARNFFFQIYIHYYYINYNMYYNRNLKNANLTLNKLNKKILSLR